MQITPFGKPFAKKPLSITPKRMRDKENECPSDQPVAKERRFFKSRGQTPWTKGERTASSDHPGVDDPGQFRTQMLAMQRYLPAILEKCDIMTMPHNPQELQVDMTTDQAHDVIWRLKVAKSPQTWMLDSPMSVS